MVESKSNQKVSLRASWKSIIDQAYLITSCPERQRKSMNALSKLGVDSFVEIRIFQVHDDPVKGCTLSHMDVMKDALRKCKKDNERILIFEDNFCINPLFHHEGRLLKYLDQVSSFVRNFQEWSILHLTFAPYCPGIQCKKDPSHNNIICLETTESSAFGTTAYIITQNAAKRFLNDLSNEHNELKMALPFLMNLTFTNDKFCLHPSLVMRDSTIKSIVNPNLDIMRSFFFKPAVLSTHQSILVYSGMQSDNLLLLSSAAMVGLMSLMITIMVKLYSSIETYISEQILISKM